MNGTPDCQKLESAQSVNPLTGTEKKKEAMREWRVKNKEHIKEYRKWWYSNNKGYWVKRRADNPEKEKKEREDFKANHPTYRNDWEREKRNKNIMHRISQNFRKGIWYSLKGRKKDKHMTEALGYNIQQLQKHIEKQFLPGMSWDNYGEWHIDHKTPIAAFNFETVNNIDFKKCWALKNLQPLWAKDNFTKNDQVEGYFQPSLAM